MHDVYVQIVPDMPARLNGMIMEMPDGTYTVFFRDALSAKKALETGSHEFDHIIYLDFEMNDADQIEKIAHERQPSDHSSIFIINGDSA